MPSSLLLGCGGGQRTTTWTFRDGVGGVSVPDSYIDEDNPGTNYGTEAVLTVEGNSISGIRHSLLRYDISSVTGEIQSATLRLVATSHSGNDGCKVTRVETDFDESTVDWDSHSAVVAGTPDVEFDVTGAGVVSVSVATLAIDAKENRDGILIVGLTPNPENFAQVTEFASAEAAESNRPLLTIVTSP